MGRKRLKLRSPKEAEERWHDGFVYHLTYVVPRATPPPELLLVCEELEKAEKGE